MSILEEAEKKMQAALDHLQQDLKSLRTGRANPEMVLGISVEVYGSSMKVRDIATVTISGARQLVVSPFDPKNCDAIAKAVSSELGYRTSAEGNIVRVEVPEMDQALREKMAKECHKKGEESKVSVRHIRRDLIDQIREQKKGGEISEDDEERLKKQAQTLTDRFCAQSDTLSQEKEKEILSV